MPHWLPLIPCFLSACPWNCGPLLRCPAWVWRPGWVSPLPVGAILQVGPCAVGAPEPRLGSRVCPQSTCLQSSLPSGTQNDGGGLLIAHAASSVSSGMGFGVQSHGHHCVLDTDSCVQAERCNEVFSASQVYHAHSV